MKTKLLIVAAGLGTRNSAFTLNGALPKILLTVGNQTILEQIIDSYRLAPIDECVIVCMSQHKGLIETVLNFKKPSLSVTYRIDDSLSGTLLTVTNAIRDLSEPNDSWYINWSDVTAVCRPVHKTTIFTDAKRQHRNLVSKSYKSVTVTETDNLSGNVAGLFYIDKFHTDYIAKCDMSSLKDMDFDVLLASIKASEVNLVEYNDVIDLGDANKHTGYLSSVKSKETCRFFNSIEMHDDYVLKSPRNEIGYALHKIELAYYRRLPENNLFAKLLDYDSDKKVMKLERIIGQTAQSWIGQNASYDALESLIQKFKEASKDLNLLSNQVYTADELPTRKEIRDAIIKELYHGLDDRVLPFASLIGETINRHKLTSINGMQITKNFGDVKALVRKWLDNNENFRFALCHGDTNTDNTMVDEHGNIKFIDPRGYFGGLQLLGYGPVDYDLAKFVYGLTGYSAFNSAPYVTTETSDGDMQVSIRTNGSKEYQEGMFTYDLDSIDIPDTTKVLIGIIWMRLCTYIANDPVKSVLAYLHGNAIVTKYVV